MVQLLNPLGDSARLHLESSSFRAPGDLLERLDRIRNQLDQEGRLLELLPDTIEDNMELEENPRGSNGELQVKEARGEPEKHPEGHQGGGEQEQDQAGGARQAESAGQQAPQQHLEARHDELQDGAQGRHELRHEGRREEQRQDGPRAGEGAGQAGAREVPQAPGVWLCVEQDGSMTIRRGREQVSSSPALRGSSSPTLRGSGAQEAHGSFPPLPRGLEVVSREEGQRQDPEQREGRPLLQAGRGVRHQPQGGQEDQLRPVGRGRGRGRRQAAEAIRPRSPVILGMDDVFISLRRPQLQQDQHQQLPQQPQLQPQARLQPQQQEHLQQRPQPQQQPQQQQRQADMRGVAGSNGQHGSRGRARGRARSRSRSSSINRTQQRLDMVVGHQRRLARELRETKAQIEHLGVQQLVLEQERRRTMMGRGRPVSAPTLPQGSARQVIQLPNQPQSRDPRVQAARLREAAAAEADLSPRERRLLRRQRAREEQENTANTLRRGMDTFFGRNYPWGIRFGHPLTPGQVAMRSHMSAFKELERAANSTAEHPGLQRIFRYSGCDLGIWRFINATAISGSCRAMAATTRGWRRRRPSPRWPLQWPLISGTKRRGSWGT